MKTNTQNQTEEQSPESWIGTSKACQYLGISMPTIRRWIKTGKLKPKRTPTGELRFRRSELDQLLN
jgi:excisionase family DNA binding protein